MEQPVLLNLPVAVSATPKYMMDHLFIESIMCPDLVACSAFIRS